MRKSYKTISLPEELYGQLEELVKKTGFRSPTEYILYVLRRSLADIEKEKNKLNSRLSKKITKKELEEVKARLKSLGYL